MNPLAPCWDSFPNSPSHVRDCRTNKIIDSVNQVLASGCPNFQHSKILVDTNFKVENWEWFLQNYFDKDVILMVKYGWPLNISYEQIGEGFRDTELVERNHKGAREFVDQVSSYLTEETKGYASIGPFSESPFSD